MSAVARQVTSDYMARPALRIILPLALATLALSGCAKPAPETQLERVGEALDDSTSQLENLNTRIDQSEALLEQLRQERRELKDEVRTLEQRLNARATDVAVFRAVQTALLNDDALQESAIAVSVEDRIVTLSGEVRSDAELQRSIEISKGIAGVTDVMSRLRVYKPAQQAN